MDEMYMEHIMNVTRRLLSLSSIVANMDFGEFYKKEPSKDLLDDPNVIDVAYKEVQ